MPKFISKAPANSMLLGEHSVVYGYPALACALDQWIEIEWQARDDQALLIFSSLAQQSTTLSALECHPKLQFIGQACKAFQTQLLAQNHGWELRVKSQFSATIGLGSSAAVLAATLVGLNHITDAHYSKFELWEIGKAIIVDIQGRGSATDLAAALFGGVVYFQPPTADQRLKIDVLSINMDILLVYCGYKTPTAEVLASVAEHWQTQPEALQSLYQQMGAITKTAHQALSNQNLPIFYDSFRHYQCLLETLGVSDITLDFLVEQLRACPLVWATKISGSGLGDCVLAIGEVYSKHRPQQVSNALTEYCAESEILCNYQQIQLPISPLGTHIHSLTESH
ncbi:mevalonate kinase [Thiosulfatimonas sediminis]|uniref:Mevalonate kinase n=1 Tax=Thiosulfatimonas sediminis TaxID=2675054 RepID=A0A6F8PX64_9GAMM|nr:GHMP kinase [Thiosulfatimonas sediminis]BBP46594.1 mevalonate kinase [Thiosulfatimonas sediminis]